MVTLYRRLFAKPGATGAASFLFASLDGVLIGVIFALFADLWGRPAGFLFAGLYIAAEGMIWWWDRTSRSGTPRSQ